MVRKCGSSRSCDKKHTWLVRSQPSEQWTTTETPLKLINFAKVTAPLKMERICCIQPVSLNLCSQSFSLIEESSKISRKLSIESRIAWIFANSMNNIRAFSYLSLKKNRKKSSFLVLGRERLFSKKEFLTVAFQSKWNTLWDFQNEKKRGRDYFFTSWVTQ